MEGVKNFTSCLKILEDQGFEAEHMLLVQLFGCLETYWNTSNVGNVEKQAIPAEVFGSLKKDDE